MTQSAAAAAATGIQQPPANDRIFHETDWIERVVRYHIVKQASNKKRSVAIWHGNEVESSRVDVYSNLKETYINESYMNLIAS